MTMKAAIIHAERDLRIDEIETQAMGPGDVRVRIRAGGICGSDLHYYQHGGFGTVRVREPMVLGHEVAGEIVEVGAEVTHLRVGDKVAVNPSQPCGHCRYCLEGKANHCLDMRFNGSAMRMPHVQGLFRELVVCPSERAVKVADGVSLGVAAFAEPLSVCLHASRQAGALQGRRVLVTGCGPIGALSVMVARHAGAREIVATDVAEAPLAMARRIGADLALNTREDSQALAPFAEDKGTFDVVFECSGAAPAVAGALNAARPQAVFVQVGNAGGELPVALNTVVAKEINLRGSFRFHEEFAWAVEFLSAGAIDVRPLLTETVPLDEAVRAFELAGDRSRAVKVQLAL
jgi:L-idonate 5-dehydrogenase